MQIIQGDALDVLRGQLNGTVVHAVVTSPPYFRKRHYGDDPSQEIGWGSLDEYITSLCNVFCNVNLHPRGNVWVNIGDTRNPNGGLYMVPSQFAIAMQSCGWEIADEVIWSKTMDLDDGNTQGCCMTEPANGRLNGNGYEILYRFVRPRKKVSDAWSDTCAVRIPRQEANQKDTRYLPPELMTVHTSIEGRNLHNIWQVGMGQTREKHYAVYPPALCERPIAMTCPHMVCASCGNPHERNFEMIEYDEGRSRKNRIFGKYTAGAVEELQEKSGRMDSGRRYVARKPVTHGWKSTCECGSDTVPGVVLDPFMGTASTGEAALKMGRNFIGIDLYEENIKIATRRLEEVVEFLDKGNLVPIKLIK